MKKIQLSNSEKIAIVDDSVFTLLSAFTWNINGAGYAGAWIGGKQIFLHRFIIGAKKGDEVDHVNGNKMDCRMVNLRCCTHSQNIANEGPRKHNKLGIKGVDYRASSNKFRATIRVNYKKIHIGLYDTAEEAKIAYNEAAIKHFGEFSYQNVVEVL